MPDEPSTPEIYDRPRHAPATMTKGEPSSAAKRRINKLRDTIRIAARSVYELFKSRISAGTHLYHQEEASMTSTVGVVANKTGLPLTFSVGGVSHGDNPNIEVPSLDAGATARVFIAMSDGAGVEGNVLAAGPSGSEASFTLVYDNPVVGSNSGSVTSGGGGYTGTCNVGSGDDNTNTSPQNRA